MRLWQTHPFTDITLVQGQGCTVWDDRGKPYLDLLSGVWCNVLGHRHPRWAEAVKRQTGGLVHTTGGFFSPEIEWGLTKLREILPSELDRAVFLNTGSEAVELALKMARAATGADEVVIVEGGYYGATSYTLALSEVGRTMSYLPSFGTAHRLPLPDCCRCPAGCTEGCGERFPCLATLEALAERNRASVAAVLYEPVISGAGILVPPKGWGARLRELTTRCGALLISEEVTTGMGRTGRWCGFEHEGIVPDLLVLGKVLGGGLPVAAVVTTEAVERAGHGTLLHGQSHQNDPFSGAIAAEVIAILQEEGLVARAAEVGRMLQEGLATVKQRTSKLRAIRGLGAMVGIELEPETAAKGPDLVRQLLARGFIVNFQAYTRTIRLFPPYVIERGEIEAFLEAFAQVLEEV